MSSLPDLQHVGSSERPAIFAPAAQRVIQLMPTMTFEQARAVPGAIYDPAYKSMVLVLPSPRTAIVALTLKPVLGQEYPELIELRDTLLATVKPTDYATQLGLKINAPVVHQSLLDQGSDWLDFELYEGASQETDLGYAAAILSKYHFFYLGWARGYGKTLGTAAIIEHHGYDRVMVAAPNSSKVDTWKQELERRLPSHLVYVMPNEKQARLELLDFLRNTSPARFVLVTHHESLALIAKWGRRDGKDDPKYGGWRKLHITWDLFVVDEVHRLAHTKTRMHQGARNVPASNRLGLSGSVYQNDWDELYGPLHWGLPSVYGRHVEDWSARHFDYVDGYGRQKIWAGFLPGHDQLVRDELGVFMIVREKPDKTIKNQIFVDLSAEQRRVYQELSDLYVSKLDDETFIVAQEGVVMLTRLRQIASGLELLADHIADSTKLEAAVGEIQRCWDLRRDDFFVAAWYRASAYALRERLSEVGITAYVITGDTPMGKRPGIIAAARADAAVPNRAAPVVLIGTIPTLGESVNLQFLNHVIRIDRSWNPALNRQVVDRVDRTGQQRDAYLTDLIARDTVDELVVMPNLANKDAMRAMLLGRIS